MYETMEVYPLSWVYYLTFIFLSAFAFLNMVIGIVVSVMEQENEKARIERDIENQEPTLRDVMAELHALRSEVEQLKKSPD